MLVLSRKTNETIRMLVSPSEKPQVIDVVVTEVRGGKVRLSINADDGVRIHRLEVFERIAAGEQERGRPEKPPIVPFLRLGDDLPGMKTAGE